MTVSFLLRARRHRRGLCALVGLVVIVPMAGNAQAVDPLAAERTRADLVLALGHPRTDCVASRPGLELCEWSLGNRDAAWKELARTIGTDARVAVVCELPADGSPRAAGSCTLHPRESNHAPWALPNVAASRRGSGSLAERRAARERVSQRAQATLAQARTLVEISRLIGAAPDQCLEIEPGLQSCLWRATSRTFGHGMLAATIEAPRRKKLRLECRLPTDDTPREANSCSVEIGV